MTNDEKFLGAYCKQRIEPFHRGLITTSRKTESGTEYGMNTRNGRGALWCNPNNLEVVKY